MRTRSGAQKLLDESATPNASPVNGPRKRGQGLVELISYHWQNAYSMTVLDGVTSAAVAEGLQVVIRQRAQQEDADLVPATMRNLGRVGAIFVNFDPGLDPVQSLLRRHFPVVVVDPLRVRDVGCVSIGSTDFMGGLTATKHLLGLGHRRIGHAAGPNGVVCSEARLAGYVSALHQAGVTLDETLVTYCDFTYEGGQKVASAMFDRPDRPTAVFAACDEIALGLREGARRRSIRVPQDLSVVGYDDTFLARQAAPPLTTVAQPLLEMGRLAMRSLSQIVKGEPSITQHLELATHLVVRDSTAPPTR